MSLNQKINEVDGELAHFVESFSTVSTLQRIQALKHAAKIAGHKAAKYQSLRASIDREVKHLNKQLKTKEVQNG